MDEFRMRNFAFEGVDAKCRLRVSHPGITGISGITAREQGHSPAALGFGFAGAVGILLFEPAAWQTAWMRLWAAAWWLLPTY
jgi:hypothetical protein